MPAVNRYYSSVAIDTTLKFAITDPDATSIEVNSTAGFPTSYPYTLALGYDLSNEELVTIIGASGTILTVGVTVAGGASAAGRGVDGTNNQTHAAGEMVKHVISARDMTEAQAHIAAEAGAHGITGTFVGTTDPQTLTNKTITGGTVNSTTLQQGGVPAVTTTGTQTLTNKTLTAPKVNEDVAVTATATELNVLDGITASTAELNIMDGVTATAAEINILDGATLSTTELNYVDGVTSAIQTQINTNTPVGSIIMYGSASAPTGWLLCNGQSTASYPALAAVVGSNVPDLRGRVPMGVGTGRNVADTANLTARTLGKLSDAETVTLTVNEMPSHAHPLDVGDGAGAVAKTSWMDRNVSHDHGVYDPGHSHWVGAKISNSELAGYGLSVTNQFKDRVLINGANNTIGTDAPGTGIGIYGRDTNHRHDIAAQGGGQGHNNIQPSTVVNFIIKH